MKGRAARRLLAPAALAGIAAACTGGDFSPVGAELLPGGILDGGLQVAVSHDFSRATDFAVFPAGRSGAEVLVTSLEWPEPPGFESRTLLRFNFTGQDSLPGDAELVSAVVRFAYDSTPGAPVEFALHRLTSEWSGEAATWERRLFGASWETPGGDFDVEPVAVFEIGPEQPDSVQVPVPTDLIDVWRRGEQPNFGLVLVQRTPGVRVVFDSRGVEVTNPDGPTLRLEVLREGAEEPTPIVQLVREDTFIVIDRAPLAEDPGLLVSGAEPVHRTFLRPTLSGLPPGATVASAQLILFVDAVRVPEDTLDILALPAASEFRGEKTIFAPAVVGPVLGRVALTPETQPGDSVVFAAAGLTVVVRAWLADPSANRGLGLRVADEATAFGGVRFHGLDAPPELRPRIRLVFLPPQVAEDR